MVSSSTYTLQDFAFVTVDDTCNSVAKGRQWGVCCRQGKGIVAGNMVVIWDGLYYQRVGSVIGGSVVEYEKVYIEDNKRGNNFYYKISLTIWYYDIFA